MSKIAKLLELPVPQRAGRAELLEVILRGESDGYTTMVSDLICPWHQTPARAGVRNFESALKKSGYNFGYTHSTDDLTLEQKRQVIEENWIMRANSVMIQNITGTKNLSINYLADELVRQPLHRNLPITQKDATKLMQKVVNAFRKKYYALHGAAEIAYKINPKAFAQGPKL